MSESAANWKAMKYFSGRKSKFLNKKVKHGHLVFDSKKEFARFKELNALQDDRVISDLELQPKFYFMIDGRPLKAKDKGSRAICYVADFKYYKNNLIVVEDVKSSFTKKDRVFRLKKALFDTIYGPLGYELTIIE